MYNTTNNYPVQQTYVPVNRPIYQQQQFAQPYLGIKGRPVASIEEARASIIDFDGSIFYFPDLANQKIYTKQIGMDGSAILHVYELKEIPVEENIIPGQYITREEFDAAIESLRALVNTAPQDVPAPQQPAAKPILNF